MVHQLSCSNCPSHGFFKRRGSRVDRSRQEASDFVAATGAGRSCCYKKKESLLESFEEMISSVGLSSAAQCQRLRSHALSFLVGLGRSTVTGMLSTQGKTDCDWSADYRFYSQDRLEIELLWDKVHKEVHDFNASQDPLVVGIDDTLIRKRGRKIPGVAYRRDPLGPPFSCNFVLGQRFLQCSAVMGGADESARMIPIDFTHAPSAKKPKAKAPDIEWKDYRKAQKQLRITQVAVERLTQLQKKLSRDFIAVGDGGYTNSCVLKGLPDSIKFIGRVRKDAKMYKIPTAQPLKGRKRRYGDALATPEEIRQDDSIAWQKIEAFACGKLHQFRLKVIPNIRLRMDGGKKDCRLIVIAPLAYRPRKGSRLLYRQPAYLICSDPTMSAQKILQYYLWRWDVEVNFRDEKTLFGVGQAQVRNPASVNLIPQLQVAAYALLLLAAAKNSKASPSELLPPPKWRKLLPNTRPSTGMLINQLRCDLWKNQINPQHFSNFAYHKTPDTKSEKCQFNIAHALFRAAA